MPVFSFRVCDEKDAQESLSSVEQRHQQLDTLTPQE